MPAVANVRIVPKPRAWPARPIQPFPQRTFLKHRIIATDGSFRTLAATVLIGPKGRTGGTAALRTGARVCEKGVRYATANTGIDQHLAGGRGVGHGPTEARRPGG